MDFPACLLTFTLFWKMSWSLQCYRCDPEHTPAALPCSHFDGSSRYIVECPISNMCFKKITTLEFADGVKTQNIQRGCAQQTMDGEQEKINGRWQMVTRIRDVYGENCTEDPSDSERATKTVHCYCRGDRCNNAGSIKRTYAAFAMSITLLALI